MWKYLDKENLKEFILSLNLIKGNKSCEEVLNSLYAISNNNKKYYTKKYINKKDGTKRELLVPSVFLKNIQKNILNNVLYGLKASVYGTGYLPNISIKNNALPHINKKVILKLDIKNFFENITFEHLYRALPSNVFPPQIKVLLIKLCTYDDYLPQGAPTSPMLSNLAMKSFDEYIGEYCKNKNISYTRYCDDLTFSGEFNAKMLKNKVEAFLNTLGFNLNDKKTQVLYNHSRQIVTGIVVNNKLNAPKNYRKKLRQELYYINKYGLDSHLEKINTKDKNYMLKIKGKINYVNLVNKNDNVIKIKKESSN